MITKSIFSFLLENNGFMGVGRGVQSMLVGATSGSRHVCRLCAVFGPPRGCMAGLTFVFAREMEVSWVCAAECRGVHPLSCTPHQHRFDHFM